LATTTYTPPDQRPQIERLKKERDKYYRKFHMAWTSMALFILTFLLAFYAYKKAYTSLFYASLVASIMYGIMAFIFLKIADNKRLMFRCPRTSCGGETRSDYWQCGCGHIHHLPIWRVIFGGKEKVIGEPCDSCTIAATHYFCPDCNKKILLDDTRPPERAAMYPGWVAPPRPPTPAPDRPLTGFPDEDLD
jgi:hypothetical protein